MAQGWMLSDALLQTALQAWLSSLYPYGVWQLDLWTNDRDPEPGDVASDYTLPTWPGYVSQPITLGQWGRAATADHVAVSTYDGTLLFAIPEGAGEQAVFGYMLTDNFGTLQYSEAFSVPPVVAPPGGVWVTPVLRCSILPYVPPEAPRGRGRPRGRKSHRADS